MRVLIISGHPRKDSFINALAQSFHRGVIKSGLEVDFLDLSDLKFEMNVLDMHPQYQAVSPDLQKAKNLLSAADHLVFIFPTWWGNMPALLKAFIDRTFVPGFAFREINYGNYQQLFKGKSAQILTTMDIPKFIYKNFIKAPSIQSLRTATLNLCGVNPVKVKYFVPINFVTEDKRKEWIAEAEDMGYQLKDGFVTTWDRFKMKVSIWIKALRLQFYVLTFILYWVGALVAEQLGGNIDYVSFWIGYIIIFCTEAATVFSNDYYDQKTDQLNENFSPFTGGSRTIPSHDITPRAMKRASILMTILVLIFSSILFLYDSNHFIEKFAVISICLLLGVFYTTPPVKLSYRTLGEITVAATHSFGVILAGYFFQNGDVENMTPWLLSIPAFLSVLPAIIMSAIPDMNADRKSGKISLAVRYGVKTISYLSIFIITLATISGIILYHTYLQEELFLLVYLVIPHAIYLIKIILDYVKEGGEVKRLDNMMVWSLLFMVWYAVIPLLKLL